jgi:hypothetical protein
MLDSDMCFPPNLISHLLDRALRNDIKFLSGIYFTKDITNLSPVASDYAGVISGAPTFMPKIEETLSFLTEYSSLGSYEECAYLEAPDDVALMKIGGAGAGCLLVHREILEKMTPPYFSFERGCSEDYYFCLKTSELDYPLYADLSIQCGHYMISAVSYRTFVSRYPKGQSAFRQNVGNSHIYALMPYYDKDSSWVIDTLRETKTKEGILGLINFNISAQYATILNSFNQIITDCSGYALVYGNSAGTEDSLLIQNHWTVSHYEQDQEIIDYIKFYLHNSGIDPLPTFLSSLTGDYDLILALDTLSNDPDPLSTLFRLTEHLISGGFLVAYVSANDKYDHTADWSSYITAAGLKQITPIIYKKL